MLQRLGHSPGLECVGRKMEFMILLFVSIGISECFSSGAVGS